MSAENTQNPALIAILGILGILAIALAAGLFLMQKQDDAGPINFSTALSSRGVPTSTEEFDPISWAREGAAYPPLEEAEALQGDFVADYTGTGALPEDDADIPEPVAIRQPVSAAPPPPAKVDEPTAAAFREVRENAYWVQVFSSGNMTRAEGIRDALTAKGFPAAVQIRIVDGDTWYRVRIGAFDGEDEAENYAEKVRAFPGYESSYVVISPVTRQIPVSN
ncbi:MAG: SPOR domain-containing protein [Spirochaetaceae bacterium]|nr:SPOR domain-containing protein [Spirochaetaceae bacterium]MDT8299277.1 SPOR domain-containing protein [Spirochaetaceae bacterium]